MERLKELFPPGVVVGRPTDFGQELPELGEVPGGRVTKLLAGIGGGDGTVRRRSRTSSERLEERYDGRLFQQARREIGGRVRFRHPGTEPPLDSGSDLE